MTLPTPFSRVRPLTSEYCAADGHEHRTQRYEAAIKALATELEEVANWLEFANVFAFDSKTSDVLDCPIARSLQSAEKLLRSLRSEWPDLDV
jgi:hypothetical protein